MSPSEQLDGPSVKDESVSILALGATLLRSRWRIVRWMLLGAIAAAASIAPKGRTYRAYASFFSQGSDAGRSGLASLAGQIGIALPTGDPSLSPDFYLSLLHSRVLLLTVIRDTVTVEEMGGKRMSLLDLFEVPAGPSSRREEQGVAILRSLILPSVVKLTGVVEVSVSTPWRSVSLQLVTSVLDAVNAYNERTRQGQASSEREFIEGRLALATGELRDAENRLAAFLRTNRNISGSPELVLDRERLERHLTLRQQVFTTLTQGYEEARIREVRDTPVITVFEPPSAPSRPQPRGLLVGVVLGSMLGALIGTLLSLTSSLLARRREGGSGDAEEFASALRETRNQLFGGVWVSKSGKRP